MSDKPGIVSMGCKVERKVCAICGNADDPCEHVISLVDGENSHPIGVLSEFKVADTRRDSARIYELGLSEGISLTGATSGTAGEITAYSFGVVPAPKCGHCGQSMVGVHGTARACTNMICPEKGRSVETGVGMMLEEVAHGRE